MDYKDKLKQTYLSEQLLIKKGKETLAVPVRIPCFDEAVIIDAINFVMHTDTFGTSLKHDIKEIIALEKSTDYEREKHLYALQSIADMVANQLSTIFGDDFLKVIHTGKGRNFYKYSFTIGEPDKVLGHICFGGQRDTILVMITGAGCQFADNGWEYELYNFLTHFAEKPKITRIDLAHDDFNGDYLNVLDADEAETRGDFMLTNKRPSVQHLGDWKHHNGNGRTLQIGKRENGKLIRIYEKGKQFGDKESPWCRAEVEFGSKSRHLPFEMLLSPTEFFAGAYPFTYELIDTARNKKGNNGLLVCTRIETIKNEELISIEKAFEVCKKQFGRYIRAFRDILNDDFALLDKIQCDKTRNYYPKRLRLTEKMLHNPPAQSWAIS